MLGFGENINSQVLDEISRISNLGSFVLMPTVEAIGKLK